MFERYTEAARRVIFFARHEASTFGARCIEPEHMVLGLFREAPELMNRLIPEGMTASTVRAAIETHTPSKKKWFSSDRDIPLASASKKALLYAANESDQTGTWSIAPEHLLLGLLNEQGGRGSHLLAIPVERLTLLRTELRPEPVGQSFSPARRWHALKPWVRGIRSILCLLFGLLMVQLAAKVSYHELFQSERPPYTAAILITGGSLCGLTALMRKRFWISRANALHVYYCLIAVSLLDFALLLIGVDSAR